MQSDEQRDFINKMLSEANQLHGEPAMPPILSAGQSDDEVLELGDNFDFDGFQVVRREFFAHINEPSVTFNNCKFYVNAACIQKFEGADTVQVLVNKEKIILAIMPCPANARDSFAWC